MDVLITIGILLLTVVLAILTWVSVPGTFLMSILALIIGWATGFADITGGSILALFAVSVFLEVTEWFLGGLTARLYGASRRSAVFAILGGIVGAIIGLGLFVPFGALVGLLAGSYLGAYASERLEGRSGNEAARAALGAVIGNVVSKSIKSAAVVIIGIWLVKMLV